MQVFAFSLFIMMLYLGQLNAAELRRDDKVNLTLCSIKIQMRKNFNIFVNLLFSIKME